MHFKKSTVKFYFRFLCPYLILLLLPITILGYINYTSYIDVLKKEINANYSNQLNLIKSEVDAKLSGIKNIVYQMSSDQELIDRITTYSQYDYYQILSMLTKYKSLNNDIYDIVLYKRFTDIILSSDCQYTVPEFINHYYRYSSWSEVAFTQFINNIDKSSIRSTEFITTYDALTKQIITLAYPFSVFKQKYNSTLLILIEEDNIRQIFQKHNDLSEDYVMVMNKNGMFIGPNGNLLSKKDTKELFHKLREKDSFVLPLAHDEYLVNSVQSKATGLTYVSLCPTSVYMKKINHIQFILLIALFIILTIGIIVIILYARKNTKPLFDIYQSITSSKESTNYLEDIKNAISTLSREKLNLSEKLMHNQPAVNDYYLTRLLSGYYQNMGSFMEDSQETSIRFGKEELFVLIISVHYLPSVEQQTKLHIKSMIDAYVMEYSGGYGLNVPRESYIYLLSAIDDDFDGVQQFQDIMLYVQEELHYSCTMGIGNPKKELNQLGQSLIEAQIALEYEFINGTNRIIHYRDICQTVVTNSWYPVRELEALHNVIHFQDMDKINYYLDLISKTIKESYQPISIIKSLCYELMYIFMKQLYEQNLHHMIIKNDHFDITHLVYCKTVDELMDMLKEMAGVICQVDQEDSEEQSLVERILMYIDANCYSCDFSIRSLADHFDMSQSSLSQHFKHYTNKTLSSYVDNRRIERAKLLIKSTKEPIKDILPQIGYYDNSSFTRKFKQIVGVTPGKYRILYKDK